jgi:hypothetical protein
MMNKLTVKIITIIYLLLYICIILMDLSQKTFCISSDKIKYFCILFCFFISLLTGKNTLNTKDLHLLQLGLFLTALADLCLIIFNYFALGITLFCLVQITYSIRYKPDSALFTLKFFASILVSIIIGYLIISFFIVKLDILFVIALFYSVCLITSFTRAQKNTYPKPNKYMAACGMLLFLLCDINVGLRNISSLINMPEFFIAQTYTLIFIFYLPSQLLLALSGINWSGS